MKKKGFTLIELISVLVILAILALIATPLVMNIVKKAKISADKRSVDAYGKSVELAVAGYLMDYGKYPTDISNLTVEYSGNEVTCGVMNLNDDGSIYLSKCSVKGTEVLDDANEDGYYHFGKLVGASSSYTAYSIGDEVTYNGVNYYVIENSDETMSTLHLLKAEPLTYEETTTYGSTSTNKTNNGYGYVYFDSSEPYLNDYSTSQIKSVVDAWASANTNSNDLLSDSTGYEVRLLTINELKNNLAELFEESTPTGSYIKYQMINDWSYNSDCWYWTMSPYEDSTSNVWFVGGDGVLRNFNVGDDYGVVRPVINILKSAI